MPTRGDTQINTFVKGLVTEASPLSFPPNTALDILNFKLQKDGTNFRRLGLDFEDDYVLTATGYSTDVLATARKAYFHWPLPNGNPLVDIGVVQIGAKFWFLNLYSQSPSTTILNGGNPVTSGVDPSSKFSFAVINNYLLVVSNNLPDPYLVSYNGDTDTITFETSPLLVRDLWGVDDGIGVGDRPTTLTPAHRYNLLNQGWSEDIVTTCGAGINALDCTFNTFGIYPANSDVWTIGRIGDLTSADVLKYDPNIAARNIFNIGQVPQGHYIVELKNRGADRFDQTGLTLPLDREVGTVACVAAYAGRAFYSGILSQVEGGDSRSPILSGVVLFSQVFEQKLQLVKCYQEADPTSPDISDILDTDGGVITIPECSVINQLRAVKESLLVFAVNGIWEIRGGEGGFTATSFQVRKISNVGVYSPDSIVEINGQVLFWGINGIYALSKNQFDIWETQSLTQPTIQKLYNSIPDYARSQAKGYYDLSANTVRWLFYSDSAKIVGQPIDIQPPAILTTQIGSIATETSGTWNIDRVDCVAMSTTQYLICFSNSVFTTDMKAVVASVDGTSVTLSSVQSLFTGSFSAVFLAPISNSQALLVYDAGGNARARVITISGTTATAAAEQLLTSSPSMQDLIQIDTGKYLLGFNRTGPNNSVRVLSVSGTTVTDTASIDINAGSSGPFKLSKVSTTEAWAVCTLSPSLRQITISGTTPTLGTTLSLTGTSLGNGGEAIDMAMINSTTAGISYMSGSTSNVFISDLTTQGTVKVDATKLSLDTSGVASFSPNKLLTIYVKRLDGLNRGPVNYFVDNMGSTSSSATGITELTSTECERIRVKSLDESNRKAMWVGRTYPSRKLITQVVQIGN